MAGNIQETYDNIKAKVRILIDRHKLLLEEQEESKRRIARLTADLEARDKLIERMRMEIDYLKIATTIAPARADVEKSRALISGLVREINLCIDDLTQ